jgi:hypothetical protein
MHILYFAVDKLQPYYKRIAQRFENNHDRHLKQVIKKLQNSKDYDMYLRTYTCTSMCPKDKNL